MLVVIRGAGDLASGIALRLWRSGVSLVMTDLPRPTSIRRTVCFSEAIRLGQTRVEDVEARRAETPEAALALLRQDILPVLPDPKAACVAALRPDAVVDAILAKKNLGTAIHDAPTVIGVGPGFTAGVDCHAVVETKRGHYLGRVIHKGGAIPDTGIPGSIAGHSADRVLRAPRAGTFTPVRKIGDRVTAGETAATVDGVPMPCTIDGVLRGLLPEGTEVFPGMKSGDIDPRPEAYDHCFLASEKALAIGGGVLEAILERTSALRGGERP